MDLHKLVLDKIASIGDDESQKYFEVSAATISAWKLGRTVPKLAAAQKVVNELPAHAPATAVAAPVAAEEVWEEPVKVGGAVTLLMPMMHGLPPETFTTLVRACKLYGMDKISIIPRWRTLIVEARNDLAHKFLATKNEWCIFIDADGVFPCGSGALLKKIHLDLPEPKASRNVISQLMSHPADKLIVGALYKDRAEGIRAQCEIGFRSAEGNARLMGLFNSSLKNGEDGLEACPWVGFGAVRVHRSVFEKMIDAAKLGGPLADIAPPVGREGEPYGFFDTTRQARGEDVKFCRRAGQLGISVWLDRGCLLGHFGTKIY